MSASNIRKAFLRFQIFKKIFYFLGDLPYFCQTLALVLRLRVDFVLPLSQQEEQEEEEQPLTKIYQKGVY